MMGVTIDMDCRTTLPGLWAAGEVTASGLHGANRLASNSLLEALVHGVVAGEGVSRAAAAVDDDFRALPLSNPRVAPTPENLDLIDIRNSLKSLMWRACGVRRDAAGLTEAAESIGRWCRYVLADQFYDPGGWELQNMLCVARLMIQSALERTETRGCHVRTDFPRRTTPVAPPHHVPARPGRTEQSAVGWSWCAKTGGRTGYRSCSRSTIVLVYAEGVKKTPPKHPSRRYSQLSPGQKRPNKTRKRNKLLIVGLFAARGQSLSRRHSLARRPNRAGVSWNCSRQAGGGFDLIASVFRRLSPPTPPAFSAVPDGRS